MSDGSELGWSEGTSIFEFDYETLELVICIEGISTRNTHKTRKEIMLML